MSENNFLVIDLKKLIDIDNLYICICANNQVDLFRKKQIKSDVRTKYFRSGYSTLSFPEPVYYYYHADIFIGYYDSTKIGINILHDDDKDCDVWVSPGRYSKVCDGEAYKSSCAMSYAVSYDIIRQEMVEKGELSNILVGKTTPEEITAVLRYFEKNNPKAKRRDSKDFCGK